MSESHRPDGIEAHLAERTLDEVLPLPVETLRYDGRQGTDNGLLQEPPPLDGPDTLECRESRLSAAGTALEHPGLEHAQIRLANASLG